MSPYTGIGNNPIVYTDPDGELFVWDDWFIGFYKGLIRSIKGKHEKGHHTILGDAFASANRHVVNYYKILGGLFAVDKNRPGYFWQIPSRIILQTPQTLLGLFGAEGENMFGQVTDVDYCLGATTVTAESEKVFFGATTAYTLGSYIVGGNDLEASVYNYLFQHEFGHYLQSQDASWFYLPRFAIPSAWNVIKNGYTDLSHPVEQDAQARSLLYLTKYVDDFGYESWKYRQHPFWASRFNKITYYDPSIITEKFLINRLMFPKHLRKYLGNNTSSGSVTPGRIPYKE